jgi:hypothetical protein
MRKNKIRPGLRKMRLGSSTRCLGLNLTSGTGMKNSKWFMDSLKRWFLRELKEKEPFKRSTTTSL